MAVEQIPSAFSIPDSKSYGVDQDSEAKAKVDWGDAATTEENKNAVVPRKKRGFILTLPKTKVKLKSNKSDHGIQLVCGGGV